ncbi:hypothetical protein B0H13DRAFT_2349834 [Mycena leptocephala]|nr:hypothetical protein B0H13DRAFT_2349834 [Mycena leptocephala]
MMSGCSTAPTASDTTRDAPGASAPFCLLSRDPHLSAAAPCSVCRRRPAASFQASSLCHLIGIVAPALLYPDNGREDGLFDQALDAFDFNAIDKQCLLEQATKAVGDGTRVDNDLVAVLWGYIAENLNTLPRYAKFLPQAQHGVKPNSKSGSSDFGASILLLLLLGQKGSR